MKKFKMLLAAAAIITAASSCKKEIDGSGHFISQSRPVSGVTEVESDGDFFVIIKQDSLDKVELYGEDNILPHVRTEKSGNKLRIYFDDDKRYDDHGLTITVHVTSVSQISLEGSGIINSEGMLNGERINVDLDGSGKMEITMNCTYGTSHIDGSGLITLHGEAVNGEHTISGSGNIEAYDLVSQNASVQISGSGHCSVNVSDHLHAIINGSGSIQYIGNPEVNTSITGSGHVGRL